jgi:response regulator RpfG family c-di-GMP phosphodiesterase
MSIEKRDRQVLRAAVGFLVRQLGGSRSSLAVDRAVERLHACDVAGLDRARRVAATSVTIAGALHIGEPLLGHVWRAGLLHDVGALAVPGVFARLDGLTVVGADVERLCMQAGMEALRSVPYLAPAAAILAAAGERFDGSGWPLGLRGAAIPIGARIVAVAEAFHRTGGVMEWPVLDGMACAEVLRGAGAGFDPEIVAACLHAGDTPQTATC